MNNKTIFLLAVAFFYLSHSTIAISATPLFESTDIRTQLQYRSAADYSHLNWQLVPAQPVKIEVLPIKNFSGIPVQMRDEKADYFNHGKIPRESYLLFSDLINASRYFRTDTSHVGFANTSDSNTRPILPHKADYRFQLTIEQYQLPFDYAPNDIWWKELNANVDRWFASARNAKIKLSLKVSSASKHITSWSQSIETTLSNCDLNANTQPLTSALNQNQTINQYLQTTPGQAFVAASNYLILQAVQYINQKPGMAQVIRNDQNEIHIQSDTGSFVPGELLGLYFRKPNETVSALPAGQVQIIKSYENQAIAYPINLRIDQIKAGDWVELGETYPFIAPKPIFSDKNHCAPVSVAQAE